MFKKPIGIPNYYLLCKPKIKVCFLKIIIVTFNSNIKMILVLYQFIMDVK